MSISRSLNLALSLTGSGAFKRTIQQLKSDAVQLRETLNNIPITINAGTENIINTSKFNSVDKSLGAQFLTPLNSTINEIRSKKSQLQSEIQNLSNQKLSTNNAFDKSLSTQFISPLNTTINGVKLKQSQLQSEIQNLSNTKIPTTVPSLNIQNASSGLLSLSNINKQINALISRGIALKISLTGDKEVRSQLSNIELEIDKLSNKLKNITIGKIKDGNINTSLNQQVIQPLNNAVNQVKIKSNQIKQEIQNAASIQNNLRVERAYSYGQSNQPVSFFTQDLSNYAKNINSVRNLTAFSNITPDINNINSLQSSLENTLRVTRALKYGQNNQVVSSFTQDLSNYAKNINSVKSLKQLPNIVPQNYNNKYFSDISNYVQNINNLKNIKQLPNVTPTFDTFNSQISATKENISSLIQTGFGLHIVQIYLAPILYGLEQISAKIISTYSEFDKLFVNYKVKSEEFGEWLSKSDFYSSSIGQTFGISNAAKTAERFAASGIDVAQSQQALTSVMQVATAADMDYTEAANGVIQTLAAMHMQVGQTTEVTDALINSANASTAELSDLVSWFQYSASSAYQMGVNVQDLSAYLGVLANTGTPQTGAAMRQLFLQLSKEDIQKQFQSKFSWITEKDLTDFNTLISDMRTYVRSQDDQKAATLEITRLLGGKANAQQALQNLLMAEPEMWNNITNAVKTSGSTQDLYNKITDNAADSIKKIQVNLEIILTQLGESVGPILSVMASVFTMLTNAIVKIPGPIKSVIGLIIFFITALAAIAFVAIGVVGALLIIAGTTSKLIASETLVIATTQGWSVVLKKLFTELTSVIFAGTSFSATIKNMTVSTASASTAVSTLTANHLALSSIMTGLAGGFVGYIASSSLMQKQMYSEAYVVGHLTAMWIAYNAAKAASVFGPVAAIGAATIAGVSYEALVYDQIETMKNNAFNAELNKQIGKGSTNITNNKKTDVYIANANISSDGLDMDDLLEATDSDFTDDY